MADRRFRHGLIVGKFYPLHEGHSFLIRTALSNCDSVTVEVLGATVETVPLGVRVDWVVQEHPTARVVSAIDDAPVDFASSAAWDAHMAVINGLLSEPVDVVYTSDDYGSELARRLGAQWIQVDRERRLNPVSGRGVRADLEAHWHMLPSSVRQWFVRRIAVGGPGAEALAQELAQHYGVPWVGGQRVDEEVAARRSPRPVIFIVRDAVEAGIPDEPALWLEAPAVSEAGGIDAARSAVDGVLARGFRFADPLELA